jgi:hypothetical protein
MKVKEFQTYQSIKMEGSRGQLTFFSHRIAGTRDFEMEVVPGIGVQVTYEYNVGADQKAKDILIVPFANISYLKEVNKEVKAKVVKKAE